MLYVFQVDRGVMMTLDMDLALTSVQKLKQVIYEKTKISVERQVLLVSGGSALEEKEDVCHYSAGTDTNPIFLFSISSHNKQDRYNTDADEYEDMELRNLDVEMKNQVEASLKTQINPNTIFIRTQLFQVLLEKSSENLSQFKLCIHHQHFQQQGWAAVVANLEDLLVVLRKKYGYFVCTFEDFLKTREERIDLLNGFDQDILLLSKIPLLPALTEGSAGGIVIAAVTAAENSLYMTRRMGGLGDLKMEGVMETSRQLSLLDFIGLNNLDNILDQTKASLMKFDSRMLMQIQVEYNGIMLEDKDHMNIKEIIGLGDRLSTLQSYELDGKTYMDNLKSLAETVFCKTKYGPGKDEEAILSQSHTHLRQMLSYYLRISDIRKRCIKAKSDLSTNIVYRLNWIKFLEKKIHELQGRFLMIGESLKRLESNLKYFEQMHHAPKLYFEAISEVLRRNVFSKQFLQWSNRLSSESREIYEKEVVTRKKFFNQMSTHFLFNLFPGLNDFPPPFATEKPEEFDQGLPQLTPESLEILRSCVPELSHLLVVEDTSSAIPPIVEAALRNNDNTNTLTQSFNDKEVTGEVFASAATSPQKGSLQASPEKSDGAVMSPDTRNTSRPTSLLRDQPESETDTEEFEKVCGSISDGTYSPMESVPDTKVGKTKHTFPCHPSDPKHIKLDSSHQADSPTDDTIKLGLEGCADRNYTESSATTTTTSSGANRQSAPTQPAAPLHVKSHHVITAELQKQIDEKNLSLLALQSEVGNSKTEVENLQTRLNALANLSYESVVQELRKEMASLKDQVKDDGSLYLAYISEMSTKLLEILEKIQRETAASEALAIQSALSTVRSEEDERRNTLQAQLSDTYRELEIYQEQTRININKVERLKAQMKEERQQLIAEKEESVKKLTLEHELEMEALKEGWQKEEADKAVEVSHMKEKIASLETVLSRVEREKASLNEEYKAKYEAKLKEKEENIRQILNSSYSEREKKNLEAQKEELQKAFESEKLRLLEEEQAKQKASLEELKMVLEAELKEKLEKAQSESDEKHSEELDKCRELWEVQKEEEVEGGKEEVKTHLQADFEQRIEKLKLEYKMELEGLRSRFRMMTTASMDKSPSETSLEKFERGDFIETSLHDFTLNKLREELLEEKEKALEEVTKSLEEKHQKNLEEERLRNEEKRKEETRRIEAEKQELFNAAFKEVSQDKERVIEDLRLRVEFLTEETEKLRKVSSKAQEGTYTPLPPDVQNLKLECESYQKEIGRLEKEVQRAKRLSFISEKHPDMSSTETASTSSSSTVQSEKSVAEVLQKCQQENKELKNALGRTYSDRKKISLDDAQVHDFVLIVWDEIYNQYRVLLEGTNVLHFLHFDCYGALGLSKGPGRPEKLFCTAQVTKKKEFCQAKRDGNRFNVPKGTKFYRVEAGPCGIMAQEDSEDFAAASVDTAASPPGAEVSHSSSSKDEVTSQETGTEV